LPAGNADEISAHSRTCNNSNICLNPIHGGHRIQISKPILTSPNLRQSRELRGVLKIRKKNAAQSTTRFLIRSEEKGRGMMKRWSTALCILRGGRGCDPWHLASKPAPVSYETLVLAPAQPGAGHVAHAVEAAWDKS